MTKITKAKIHHVGAASYIAAEAHRGQFRRDGKTPYITHPAAVVDRLVAQGNTEPAVLATAWLHDVLEDSTDATADELREDMPEEVVAAVVALTHLQHVPYAEYLTIVKRNPIATKVKIADMLTNLADAPTERQILKYARGLIFLLE